MDGTTLPTSGEVLAVLIRLMALNPRMVAGKGERQIRRYLRAEAPISRELQRLLVRRLTLAAKKRVGERWGQFDLDSLSDRVLLQLNVWDRVASIARGLTPLDAERVLFGFGCLMAIRGAAWRLLTGSPGPMAPWRESEREPRHPYWGALIAAIAEKHGDLSKAAIQLELRGETRADMHWMKALRSGAPASLRDVTIDRIADHAVELGVVSDAGAVRASLIATGASREAFALVERASNRPDVLARALRAQSSVEEREVLALLVDRQTSLSAQALVEGLMGMLIEGTSILPDASDAGRYRESPFEARLRPRPIIDSDRECIDRHARAVARGACELANRVLPMTFWGEPSLPLPLETMGGRLEAEGDAVEQARREMPSSLQEYLAQFEALVAKHGTPSRYEQRLLQRMRARLHLGRNDAPAASRELSNWLEEGPGAFDALPDIDIAIAVLRAGGRLGEVAPWLERRRVLTGPAADHAC